MNRKKTTIMKNIKSIVAIAFIAAFTVSLAKAERFVGDPVRKSNAKVAQKAATCLPASSSSELNINNVRAYIETSGSMWFKEIAKYVVPKSGDASSMFASALWIGGLDITGQLKLAAIRFRQVGDDFWPGPLNLKTADIDQAVCSYYDRHFEMTKAMARNHRDHWDDPDYVMPEAIKNWPAHPYNYTGDINGPSQFLAPFYDLNGDGEYQPEKGEYPYYDFENELCPWTDENRAKAARGELPKTYEEANNISVGGVMADQVLKGDQTLWWVFNDKGAAHTESKGSPIGLEIRGQAFAFTTNDELNNMTFYSYEIINRSSYELTETYFSQWVDADLGYQKDDYVGCDVERGLGYCYNGTNVDGTGLPTHYGANPPAVGVDFFQGPYLDPDGYDNPSFNGDGVYGPSMEGSCEIVTQNGKFRQFTWDSTGKGDMVTRQVLVRAEAINGVNFGDGIVDNERFGMRRFVYHNNDNSVTGDPSIAWQYYNMLKGIWKDNSKMRFGSTGHKNKTNGPECDFMFPGESDPCNWGTNGVVPSEIWTEENCNNAPADRRFMQSAGPFTLKKGAINYITVGIPWARATTGSAWASVELLKIVDDKCQSLFESCFKVIDGPDAPDLVFQEMDQSLICYITNSQGSNNYTNTPEDYAEEDHSLPAFHVKTSYEDDTAHIVAKHIYKDINGQDSVAYEDSVINIIKEVRDTTYFDRTYRFEGYQIYQLADESVTAEDLSNPSKAILVFQCDKKNDVDKILNYEFDATIGADVAKEKVNGANTGISHTFTLTEDAFSTSNIRTLINYKKYYFMAIAYAHNCYAKYSTDDDNPCLYGQKSAYLAGNKNIKTYTVIPHRTSIEENGTVANAEYGTQPAITRIEGQGNGGIALNLTKKTIDKIMAGAPWKTDTLEYEVNAGPINVKVIDPLQLVSHDYTVQLYNADTNVKDVNDSTRWRIIYNTEEGYDTIESQTSISVNNEQILTDKKGNMMGLSVTIYNNKFELLDEDVLRPDVPINQSIYSTVKYLSSSIEFSNGVTWLTGVADVDGSSPLNWIRSGSTKDGDYFMRGQDGYSWDQTNARKEDEHYALKLDNVIMRPEGAKNFYCFLDGKEYFEKMIGGTWAPYPLTNKYDDGPQFGYAEIENPDYTNKKELVPPMCDQSYSISMTQLYSVDVVLTPDKSKWSRCPVVEACGDKVLTVGKATRHFMRKSYSVDKEGIPYNDPRCNKAEACMRSDKKDTMGMGWFPGYAICVETGERLNVMFAEDSWLVKHNGADMLFNPTPYTTSNGDYVMGGKHYLYVFGHQDIAYDNGAGKIGRLNGSAGTNANWICPIYDEGAWAFQKLYNAENHTLSATSNLWKSYVYMNIMWTSIPLATDTSKWLSSDATIKLRVSRPYKQFSDNKLANNVKGMDQNGVTNPVNDNMPMYLFSTKGLATQTNMNEVAKSSMEEVNVVPNPYYARSAYETGQLDNCVKFTNLPKNCTIKIYTLNGTLIRTFKKDNTDTYVDWDLKNSANIPIAGGVYLIHITDNVTGEIKTLKWYGIQRPTDVNAF